MPLSATERMSHHSTSSAFAAPVALRPVCTSSALCTSSYRPRTPQLHRPSIRICAHAGAPKRSGLPHDVSVVLLAGGRGTRMGTKTPKQFLPIRGQSVLERSLSVFRDLPEVREIVVVIAEEFRTSPTANLCLSHGARFADPGIDRAGSVRNGADACADDATLICVHDAARPLVLRTRVREVIRDAWTHGAAVLAVPCKATVKLSLDGEFVERTLDRSKLWEMQTPQVVDAEVLRRGLRETAEKDETVTDDVSVVEFLGLPVKLTLGDYCNLKITTQEDLVFAEAILEDRVQREAKVGAEIS